MSKEDNNTVKNEDHFGIVIGIDGYFQLDALDGSVEDATKFYQWLLDPQGGNIPERNVFPVISDTGLPNSFLEAKPVQTHIDDAFRKIGVLKKSRIGKRLYFYFAGHGYGQFYDDVGMLMANASEDALGYNIGLKHYLRFIHTWGFFDEIIFILDCCRDPVFYADTVKPGFTFLQQPNTVPHKVNDFVMLAAEYGNKAFQIAHKPQGKRRGILTQAVLEGLKEELATDAEGRITTLSLYDYVTRRVPLIANTNGVDQKPKLLNPPDNNIVLKTGIFKEQEIGVLVPNGAYRFVIKVGKELKSVGEYFYDNKKKLWKFKYLTSNQRLRKNISSSCISPNPSCISNHKGGTLVKMKLRQNKWYAFNLPDSNKTRILDLREIDSNRSDYVFKL